MRLPEPARTTFLEGWPAVESAANRTGIGAEEMRLGGGTLLATRWKHRSSIDVDLMVDPDIHLGGLYRELLGGPLAAQGWTIEYSRRLEKVLVTEPASLRTTPYGDERGRFDIWAKSPDPEHGVTTSVIEGRNFRTLSNVQVLGGKLTRGTRALPRDVADFAIGGERDSLSIEHAVNRWPPEVAGTIANAWTIALKAWGETNWEELEIVLNVSSRDAREIAGRGPEALRAAIYRTVRIEKVRNDEIHVRTSSGLCKDRGLEFSVAGLEEFLATSGFAARMRKATAERVLMSARDAPAGRQIYVEEDGWETTTRPPPPPAAARPSGTRPETEPPDRSRRREDPDKSTGRY